MICYAVINRSIWYSSDDSRPCDIRLTLWTARAQVLFFSLLWDDTFGWEKMKWIHFFWRKTHYSLHFLRFALINAANFNKKMLRSATILISFALNKTETILLWMQKNCDFYWNFHLNIRIIIPKYQIYLRNNAQSILTFLLNTSHRTQCELDSELFFLQIFNFFYQFRNCFSPIFLSSKSLQSFSNRSQIILTINKLHIKRNVTQNICTITGQR